MKKALRLIGTGLPFKDSRGNWRSFEPLGEVTAPFAVVFAGPPELFVLTLARLVRLSP